MTFRVIVFLEGWKRKQHRQAMEWGTSNFEEVCESFCLFCRITPPPINEEHIFVFH